MNIQSILLLFVLLGLSVQPTLAQKIFSEGTLRYNVYLNNETKPGGVYLITVKSGNIRRELSMNNGFSNITLFHFKTGKTYSLNLDHEAKYALELSAEELQQKNSRFHAAVIRTIDHAHKIAGYSCQSAEVTYADGDRVNIFYTGDLLPQHDSFNSMFPGLKGIALEYAVKSGSNMNMKFVANMVDINVVDSRIFDIPKDYKIVTKAELEKLK